jgi:DNA-binding CsgD family transcriptional regulator
MSVQQPFPLGAAQAAADVMLAPPPPSQPRRGTPERRPERHEDSSAMSAVDALTVLCFDDYLRGQWEAALQLADEGLERCTADGSPLSAWPFRLCSALVAAGRGDLTTVFRLTEEMSRWATPRGVRAVQNYAFHAMTLAALGRGDCELAYEQASAVSPAGELMSASMHALWISMDLVEAAVRTGRRAEAAAHVAAIRGTRIAALSPRFALLAAGSAAIAAEDDGAGELFEEAIALPGAGRWPFDLARVQLAYGERLRRGRALIEARTQLTAALESFRRLRAEPWAARTAHELAATGQTRSRPHESAPDPLTPQERQVAELAAAGLSNKQIGERLYLSHRTVGAHLYRVFPKLGVTSRAALRDALTSRLRELPREQFEADTGGPRAHMLPRAWPSSRSA